VTIDDQRRVPPFLRWRSKPTGRVETSHVLPSRFGLVPEGKPTVVDQPELILRLLLAAAAGAVVGFEREARSQSAGVRTHSLVALGAALFAVAGAYGFGSGNSAVAHDPTRVAAQVASGIGFIGAGAIIKNGATVRGVTTAATLWLAAALGVASACGLYLISVATTGIVLAILIGLRVASSAAVRFAPAYGSLVVSYERGHGTLGPLMRSLERAHAKVASLEVEDDFEDGRCPGMRTLRVQVALNDPDGAATLVDELQKRSEVRTVAWNARRGPLRRREPGEDPRRVQRPISVISPEPMTAKGSTQNRPQR
jgi:putative Mg2+ transporter-C (MgtC) family protein